MAELPDETIPVIIDALADAAEYRRWLAGSCGCQATDLGLTPCDHCAPHAAAADSYDALGDWLTDGAPAEPYRPQAIVHVRGDVL